MSSKRNRNQRSAGGDRVALKRRWSLAARLTIWYTVSAFALVLITIGFLYWSLVKNLDQEDDRFLLSNITILQDVLRTHAGGIEALKEEVEWEFSFRQYAEVYVRILDAHGVSIVETPGMAEELPPSFFPPAAATNIHPMRGMDILSRQHKPFRAIAAQATAGPSDAGVRVIQIALSNASEESLLAKYRRRLWVTLAGVFLLCALVGYRIAHRGIQPVRTIAKAAQRIRSTTLHERIDTRKLPSELWTLAETFNQMLTRLETSFAQLSQFSADLAHELRTPVNNLRGTIEVALGKPRSVETYRTLLESCLEESVRLSHTIDSLLFLARADQPEIQITKEPLDVSRELHVVREFYDAAAAQADVTLTIRTPQALFAALDRLLFQRALGNLMSNALAHTPAGGTVTIRALRETDATRIDVIDTGSGIPAEHLPHLGERFYRVTTNGSASPGGTGLGLAIVKSIIALHGGSMQITSELSKGTCVTLRFPTSSTTDILA